ncbi:MAG: efflux RND transporter periplasmic adaptor subunit [Rhodocyclaceae bacterium]|nr:efflux RND transporter periplasmic adaptor subunit [Rhodocyclaceae bacterium]
MLRTFLVLLLFSFAAVAETTRRVEPREAPLALPFEAVIEATRQAVVATQVAGRITAVKVEAGQRVAAGQLLMQVDAREAAEAIAAAQAQRERAEADYQRARNLFERKFISRAALDQAEAAVKAARAQESAARASASHAAITAPIAGVVGVRHAELGDLAMPGKPLLTVFDPNGLRAVAQVPQQKLELIRTATQARVEFIELGRVIEATRIEILPTLDTASHTATVRVYLPEAPAVLPGMAARVYFYAGVSRKLTLPREAILRRGEIAAVYVLRDGKPSLRQVRLGEATPDGEIEILAGLTAGETVSLTPVKTGIEAKKAGN